MANMSYCRWENTLKDLEDAYEHLYDEPESSSEKSARKALIELCVQIAKEAADIIEDEG